MFYQGVTGAKGAVYEFYRVFEKNRTVLKGLYVVVSVVVQEPSYPI